MENKKLKLEKEKMLGFRLLDQESSTDAAALGAKVGDKIQPMNKSADAPQAETGNSPEVSVGGKIGMKAGVKPSAKLGGKIGGKIGGKVT